MSLLRAARLSGAPAAAMGAVGVLWGGLAASWPDIKLAAGASDAELGAALLASAAGGIAAMFGAPRLLGVLGRAALPVLCLAVAGALVLPALAGSVLQLALALFVVGVAVAALDVLANVEISAREARHGVHLMGLNHALFSFAFAGAALFAGLMRQAGLGPASYLPILAGCVVLLALGARGTKRGEERPQGPDELPGAAVPWRVVVLAGIILFAGFIGENATEAWSALHIERTLGAPAGEGGFGPTVLGLVMGVARLLGQLVAERLGHGRLIFGSACLGICGTLTIAAAQSPAMVLMGVGVNALGMAVIVPSVMSMLGARVSEARRALALSRAWMLGITGFFVGPALMGGVSQLFGLRVSFALVACIVALILPAVIRLSNTPRGAG